MLTVIELYFADSSCMYGYVSAFGTPVYAICYRGRQTVKHTNKHCIKLWGTQELYQHMKSTLGTPSNVPSLMVESWPNHAQFSSFYDKQVEDHFKVI